MLGAQDRCKVTAVEEDTEWESKQSEDPAQVNRLALSHLNLSWVPPWQVFAWAARGKKIAGEATGRFSVGGGG